MGERHIEFKKVKNMALPAKQSHKIAFLPITVSECQN